MKLGSLFDGIGGFPFAAEKHGITPVWASEIEPFPVSVTKHHFPNMKHLRDITRINGAEIEPVDIITFGSPCQDLSVAGRREGLGGERSGLFSEAIRIIRDMRAATNGKYPRFAVWENVPGAFSSNNGADFKAVLEEITETEISIPRSGKWASAGMVRSNSVDVAWRVLDAQYWGVPQRRKRIFLVADFTGQRAAEILFKPESLPGDSTEGAGKREGIAGSITDCVRAAGEISYPLVANTLLAKSNMSYRIDMDNIVCFQSNASIADSSPVLTEQSPPLRTTSQMAVCFGPGGSRDVAHALRSQASKADKPDNTTYVVHPRITGTLCASGAGLNRPAGQGNEKTDMVICIPSNTNKLAVAQCLTTGTGRRYDPEIETLIPIGYAVRRLTPVECERLQGFPDGWTDIPGASDTARYKALGNSIAVPCVQFIMGGIAETLKRD